MTTKEFSDRYNEIKIPICEKYGYMKFLLANVILNLSKIEKLCEDSGFKVKRISDAEVLTAYTKLYFKGRMVGIISVEPFPSIEFYRGFKKLSSKIPDSEIIAPISGVHRILDWHKVEGKLHRLAGGQTVLHFLPMDIRENVENFLEKTGIKDIKF